MYTSRAVPQPQSQPMPSTGIAYAGNKRTAAPKFGLSPEATKLPLAIRPAEFLFEKILNTRTKEMLLEDLVGFGLLRTGIDLYRQRIMGEGITDQHGHHELNIPAARERLLREVSSIMTDNVSGGLFAFGIAAMANRMGRKNLSQNFVSDQSLTLFRDVIGHIPEASRKTPEAFESAFLKGLAKELQLPEAGLKDAYKNWQGSKGTAAYTEKLANIIKQSNPNAEGFTVKRANGKAAFELSEVLEDGNHFLKKMPSDVKGSKALTESAEKLLKQTSKFNRLQYLGIGGALGLTFGVPFAIQALTRRLDGFSNYPGDRGIRKMVSVEYSKDKSWFAQHFPYIAEAAHKKNPAVLLPLIPLLFALGIFDTRALSKFAFKEAVNIPGKAGFLTKLKDMYKFGKGFPFTTQQQMASCFAFLIFSRMITARSDIEYRERSVDSLLGWSTWILGTPLLKRAFSTIAEKRFKDVKLFQSNGKELLSRADIEFFSKSAEVARRSCSANLSINLASMLFSIATLGILEPVIAIKWTAHRARKQAQAAQNSQLPPNPFQTAIA